MVDLNLAQAFLRYLDRIVGRPDFGVGLVQMLEHGVQRGRFTGAGGAADVKQDIRLFHRIKMQSRKKPLLAGKKAISCSGVQITKKARLGALFARSRTLGD